jgi:xylulokinase
MGQDASTKGEKTYPLKTYYGECGEIEQNPGEWWNAIKMICRYWLEELKVEPGEIKAITFSGQMQDLIFASQTKVPRAILYSDTRAKNEAERINEEIGSFTDIANNPMDASSPFAKCLWIQSHQQEIFENCEAFLFSSKDYIIYKLTNQTVTDPVTASTTGMMNLHTNVWQTGWLSRFDIPISKMPDICNPDQLAGYITKRASELTGLKEGTPVLSGSGDGGATTVGAGAVRENDAYLYLGTTGWAATVQEKIGNPKDNMFTLSHMRPGSYISIAPLLNVGNVYLWAKNTFANEVDELEQLIAESAPGANGLLFLPYLNGERCPVNDPDAKGIFYGVTMNSQKADFARAIVEGLCYSYRQIIDLVLDGKRPPAITAIGGGARSKVWCQIAADVLGTEVHVPENSEFLPAVGAASSAFCYLGWAESYEEFADRFIQTDDRKVFTPRNQEIYQKGLEKYEKLYPAFQTI